MNQKAGQSLACVTKSGPVLLRTSRLAEARGVVSGTTGATIGEAAAAPAGAAVCALSCYPPVVAQPLSATAKWIEKSTALIIVPVGAHESMGHSTASPHRSDLHKIRRSWK